MKRCLAQLVSLGEVKLKPRGRGYTKYCSKYEVDWYEVSRRLRGMLSLVDPAGVR
ncbi:hypothetical protein Tco_0776019, partial [Tanacetum coccineum]